MLKNEGNFILFKKNLISFLFKGNFKFPCLSLFRYECYIYEELLGARGGLGVVTGMFLASLTLTVY